MRKRRKLSRRGSTRPSRMGYSRSRFAVMELKKKKKVNRNHASSAEYGPARSLHQMSQCTQQSAVCLCAWDAGRYPGAHKYWKGMVTIVTKCSLMNTEEARQAQRRALNCQNARYCCSCRPASSLHALLSSQISNRLATFSLYHMKVTLLSLSL